LHVCAACGLRYADPMRHPGRTWYEDSDVYDEVAWNVPPVSRLAARWEFQQFLARGFAPGSFVFDVGCGRGDFLALARARGFAVGGADLNGKLLEVARRAFGLEGLLCRSLDEIEPTQLPRRPDLVTAFEVLEHLEDPGAFLERCRRLLVPGGALFVTVPGFRRWPPLLHRVVDQPPHHLTLWTETALRRLLESHGFRVRSLVAKPLLAGDLQYHAVRAVPGALRPGAPAKLLRGLCKGACLGAAPLLRLHPRAGGFTLAAAAVVGEPVAAP
jgi:SAM-dependent methyltransferase